MTDFPQMLQILRNGNVEFIVVGGAAAIAHGSARLTLDLDILYSRRDDNMRRLVEALSPLKPYLRGAPPGLPFILDYETIRRGLNFTLITSIGDLDILGEITGGGFYNDLIAESDTIRLFGMECRCLNLERLIQVKRAAGRPKDFEAIAELEAILEERSKNP